MSKPKLPCVDCGALTTYRGTEPGDPMGSPGFKPAMCASTDRCSKRRRVRTFFRRHFGFFPSQNHIAVLLARAETSTYVPSSEEIRILDRQGRVERVRDGWLIMHGAIERDVKVVFHPV